MDGYIGEVRLFPFSYAPEKWLYCDGTEYLLAGTSYQALFSLIGNLYGGTVGQSFAVPNLQSRVVLGAGQAAGLTNRAFASTVGEETVVLSATQNAQHNHILNAAAQGDTTATYQSTPTANTSWLSFANTTGTSGVASNTYDVSGTPGTSVLASSSVGLAGGSSSGVTSAHANLQPYLGMGYFICWDGVYPVAN